MSENISFNSAELGAPVETLGYEQARAELEQVVRQLESGASDLETSIALWERGEALAARCEAWLQGAQERLNAARGAQAGQESPANYSRFQHPLWHIRQPSNKNSLPRSSSELRGRLFLSICSRGGKASASACSQP